MEFIDGNENTFITMNCTEHVNQETASLAWVKIEIS